MKMEKAVEILNDLLGEGPQFPPDDRREAVRLSIEALKRIKHLRSFWGKDLNLKLPGETKEGGGYIG